MVGRVFAFVSQLLVYMKAYTSLKVINKSRSAACQLFVPEDVLTEGGRGAEASSGDERRHW